MINQTQSEDLATLTKQENEQIRREIDEIKMLIRQTNSELDKLTQRKQQMTSRIRDMEANLETYARQEIRASYLAAQESEMRVFMMNGQLEQLQAKQRAFERYQKHLQQTMEELATRNQTPVALLPAPSTESVGPTTASNGGGSDIAKIIQTQEEERQRIAQRLHDGPAQALSNVVLSAEICERSLDMDTSRSRAELGNLKGMVNSTLQETRKFIFELRPMTLDDLGLLPTLKRYISEFEAKNKIKANFTVIGGDRRLPSQIEVTIFRIVQEALENIQKHAHATQIQISVDLQEARMELGIEDNGSGFDVKNALASAAERQTLGLASIQERVEMVKGQLEIKSSQGQGSKITIHIPL